jgi:hypothetical protein
MPGGCIFEPLSKEAPADGPGKKSPQSSSGNIFA